MALLAGCAAPRGIDLGELAAAAGMREEVIEGRGFRHRLFRNQPAGARRDAPVLVFLEGDGTPWTHGGRRAAADPGPEQPLAFRLFLNTPLPSWYITRPCYGGVSDAGCGPWFWTSGRYSERVVDTLATALAGASAAAGAPELILVGYSGGGALAVLVAARLHSRGVVSIAANLDTGAWTARHGYLPLADSLNPAALPAGGVPHVLLTGGRDRNVPLDSVAGYLRRHPDTIVVPRPEFDHGCCWLEHWQDILRDALSRLPAATAPRPPT